MGYRRIASRRYRWVDGASEWVPTGPYDVTAALEAVDKGLAVCREYTDERNGWVSQRLMFRMVE